MTLTKANGDTLVLSDITHDIQLPDGGVVAQRIVGTESIDGTDFFTLGDVTTMTITHVGDLVPFLHKIGDGINILTEEESDSRYETGAPDQVGVRSFLHALSFHAEADVAITAGVALTLDRGTPGSLNVGSYLGVDGRYRVNSILNVGGNNEVYTITVIDSFTTIVVPNVSTLFTVGQTLSIYTTGSLQKVTANLKTVGPAIIIHRDGYAPVRYN